jgi:alkanesulfonate monooxygenase SsuD/methylene tetrahydromethanopterin reductase-like flavin-dependent oxidoreductase (luciferase family)
MELGVHLPLIAFDHPRCDLQAYARTASALGYRYVCANDHLYFSRPWLDGPTALAAVAGSGLTLATTVALPVIRGPIQTVRMLSALHELAGGRLICGVGPGSSRRDYEAVGIPFEERWRRFDDAVRTLRGELDAPIWIASWGSAAGMRRVTRLGDGWLASAYNTTPEAFAVARPPRLPNALVTMWLHVTESPTEAQHVSDRLRSMLNRPALPDLLIGSAEQCAERVAAYEAAGCERIFVWPLADELRQIELLREALA